MTLSEWKAQKQRERIEEVITYFDTIAGLAELLALPHSTVRSWMVRGRISRSGARLLEARSNKRFPVAYMIPTADEWYRTKAANNG